MISFLTVAEFIMVAYSHFTTPLLSGIHGILCFFMRHTCNLLPTTEICFQTSTSIGFEVIYENSSQVPEYLWPHVSCILSNTKSSSSQLKVPSNWSKITTFVFSCITSSTKCISKFLSAWRKYLEERKLFDSSSSLNDRNLKLLLYSFGNVFCNASVLKNKKKMYFMIREISWSELSPQQWQKCKWTLICF